jgi:fatty-acyl-CoA synthase
VRIVDRTKDVIKSGGEWISSIDLENAAVAHPDVAEAAAVAVGHPKWGERPVLVVAAKPGANPTREALLAHMAERFAKWQLPDDVIFADSLPHTATGKLSKLTLRRQLEAQGYRLPDV